MTGAETPLPAFPVPRLRTMTGATELAVAEAAASARNRPEAVTALIAALFETVGDRPATPETARALSPATREYLLQWSAARLHPETRWFEAHCTACGEPYDIALDLAEPAIREPDHADATVTVATSLGPRDFALPTGAHEEMLARQPAGRDPRRAFAALCGLAPDAAGEAESFDDHDLALIDEAVEAASPDIADTVRLACPACGEETECRIDPLQFAFPNEGGILADMHLIAGAYGWPPAEILTLSARHRSRLADLIDRDRRAGDGRRR
ncbi:MAG: hypothetical protein KDJ77_08630 [Rhodobiaceae bacterium]|nr:hypothetical protein [Rhodobiaceae bacterium]